MWIYSFQIWEMFSLISSYTLSALSLFGIPIGHLLDCTLSYWLLNWSFPPPSPFPLCFSLDLFFSCLVKFIGVLFFTVSSIIVPILLIFHFRYCTFQGRGSIWFLLIMSPISFPIKFIVHFKYLNIIKYTCFKSIYLLLPLSLSFLIMFFASWILYIMNVPFLNVWILLKFF